MAIDTLTEYLKAEFPCEIWNKRIVLVTDTLYQPGIFEPHLSSMVASGISLCLLIIAGAGQGIEIAHMARRWSIIENKYQDNVNVEIVELMGLSAVHSFARGLLRLSFPRTPRGVFLRFSEPLIEDSDAIRLEAHPQVEQLAMYAISHPVCRCHGAAISPFSSSNGSDLALCNGTLDCRRCCTITNKSLDQNECIENSGVVMVGGTEAGLLKLAQEDLGCSGRAIDVEEGERAGDRPMFKNGNSVLSHLSLYSNTENNAMGLEDHTQELEARVVSRIDLEGLSAGMLIGPAIVLQCPNPSKILYQTDRISTDSQDDCVTTTENLLRNAHMLKALVATLQSNGEGLVCSTDRDILQDYKEQENILDLGFRRHYLLLPAAAGYDGSVAALCALRIASFEELVSLPHEVEDPSCRLISIPQDVMETVSRQISKITPLNNRLEGPGAGFYSSKCHEILNAMCRESHTYPVDVSEDSLAEEQQRSGPPKEERREDNIRSNNSMSPRRAQHNSDGDKKRSKQCRPRGRRRGNVGMH